MNDSHGDYNNNNGHNGSNGYNGRNGHSNHYLSELGYCFENKTALVTGAGSGIGRDLTKKIHALRGKVIAVSQTVSKLESLKKELGSRITIVSVNLSNWEETQAKLGELCKNVDFLINNAGVAKGAYVEDVTEEDIDDTMSLNLKAPINLIRLVAPGMKERRFGSIINVSSVAGISALDKHLSYAASKAALDMVTKVSAKELGPYNIRVNSINPTVVWTDMSIDYWSDVQRNKLMKSLIPMERFVEIREVVEPIVFLMSDMSSMINGILMPIDGGFVAN